MLPMLAPVSSAPPTLRSISPGSSQSQTSTHSQHTTPVPQLLQPQIPDGTLRLRGGPVQSRRVTWSEEVVDNESLGRKKSKGISFTILFPPPKTTGINMAWMGTVCCIYRRAREFGESSDESSSSDDSSSSSDEKDTSHEEGKPCPEGSGGGGPQNHNHERHGNQGRIKRRRPPSPNAYEKMPRDPRKKENSR